MNYANATTTADALALYVADITAFVPTVEIEAAGPFAESATMAEAMATIGALELNTAEWDCQD